MAYRPHNLMEETLDLLRETEVSRQCIADQAGVSVGWVNKLAQGRLKNPGYLNLDKVNKVLKNGSK